MTEINDLLGRISNSPGTLLEIAHHIGDEPFVAAFHGSAKTYVARGNTLGSALGMLISKIDDGCDIGD